jgi:uncharacterized protein
MRAIAQETNSSKVRPSLMLDKHRDAILASAKANGLSNVRVFGSVLRQTDTVNSDLDLLITSSENTSLFHLGDFQEEVERLVGASVDVVDDQWISKYYRAQVIAEARAI